MNSLDFVLRQIQETNQSELSKRLHRDTPQLIGGQVQVLERVLQSPESVARDVDNVGCTQLQIDDLEVLEDKVSQLPDGAVVDVEELDHCSLRVAL